MKPRKLNCASVMRAAQDAGGVVNVVQTLRMPAKSAYLGNAHVGSRIAIAIPDCVLAILRTFFAKARWFAEAEHASLPGFPSSKRPTCQNLDTRELGQAVSNITSEAGYAKY